MDTKEHIIDVLINLWDPIGFMILSLTYLPGTIFALLTSFNLGALRSFDRVKDAWFARFWAVAGPAARETAIQNAEPMIKAARGVVLDIGPGGGDWIHIFDKSRVTKIYGVEPNRDHYDALRRKIKDAGLADIYEIAECGVEGLTKWGIEDESVDSVITIQCLCSVGEPEKMIKDLYRKLKVGGIWVLYEHVVTKQGGWVAMYQSCVNILWPHFLGGCEITRDTEKSLREVGKWSKIDLKQPAEEPSYKILPHVMGVLEK
ncbi:hypothetical protein DSL72_006721 [Monilinia vaccinii-corymbosi]|uniref:Methyltransferase type 11 domain-containing protein n=1 Tax=Monilinia vaccinii-corymbosi TaxID=61207 RepID=A0A8A3PN53_9HELO|nr:hypothetical protein DSL72_006721 [Monilinia vaccinii-corymbosi]